MEGPRSGDGHRGLAGEDRRRGDRVSQFDAQPTHQISGKHVRGKRDVERRRRKLVKGGACRSNAHPRVRTELVAEPRRTVAIATRVNFDSDHQVVDTVGQDADDCPDDPVGGATSPVNGHDVLWHCENPAGLVAPDRRVGNQVGRLAELAPATLGLPVLLPAALVPCEGVPDGYQQSAAHECAATEFHVLQAPSYKRLVHPADQLVEILADPEVSPSHREEWVVGSRRQIVGSGHELFDPRGGVVNQSESSSSNDPDRRRMVSASTPSGTTWARNPTVKASETT